MCHFVINPLQKYDKVIMCAMFLCCFVAWASIGIALCVAVVWFYFQIGSKTNRLLLY